MENTLFITAYKRIVRIRRFEQLLESLHSKGVIKGTLHLSLGQETIGAGVGLALEQEDILYLSHRPDHYIIGRNIPFTDVIKEFLHGNGGQMHYFNKDHSIFGSYSIVGSQLPIATGNALSRRLINTPGGIFCSFGEGSTTEGIFHETMNIAALKEIPIVYICENNYYAQSTSLKNHSAVGNIAEKVTSNYGIESIKIDGNSIEKVYESILIAKDYTLQKKKPYFIEMQTYRQSGHSINDKAQTYKTEGEEIYWEQRDPLKLAQKQLELKNLISEDLELHIEVEINAEIQEVMKFLQDHDDKLAKSNHE
jgi:pyruvate dehydrogenase E1 component alpha subunit